MTSDALFSREEALGGLPSQRAWTLLFLIESRVAHMLDQSRRAMERFLTDEVARERDLAYLEAFTLGRAPPLRPAIQDLEQFAARWAHLVPQNPRLQAALAHILGQKYTFTRQAVPGIRQTLELDLAAVQQAYQRLYNQPLETIYAPRTDLVERLRWAWAGLAKRLEGLPPFWTAFSLSLTETVGVSILALPIALAGVGPLAGIVLLAALGLVNVITIAYMAETVTRSGNIRYGNAYFGRLVTDFLGKEGSFILSLALAVLFFLILLAYYIGLATSLADATRLPALLWVGLLYLVNLYFLRRESLNATVSAALLVGATNIGLILALSLFALPSVRPENLAYVNVPFLNGRPFDPGLLQLVFGVVMAAYFGHTSVGNCAKVVLRRDPGGRSLIWGGICAQLAALCLYAVWVVVVNGAIAPTRLAGTSGTALAPLAADVGPAVHVLGSIFVILGIGMGSINMSLGSYNLVREWLPKRRKPVLELACRRGVITLDPGRGSLERIALTLSYLGMQSGRPHFRLDVQSGQRTERREFAVQGVWESEALAGRIPELQQQGSQFSLQILEASPQSVRFQITTQMSIDYQGVWDEAGVNMASLLVMPDEQRKLVNWILRKGEVSLAEASLQAGLDLRETRKLLDELVQQGVVRELEEAGDRRYQACLAPRQGTRQLPDGIWKNVAEEPQANAVPTGRARPLQRLAGGLSGALSSERGRFMAGVAPLTIVVILSAWQLLTNSASFSGPIGFLGVIVISLLAVIFPALLLVSSRRKGELQPGVVFRFLGHPLLIGFIYLLGLSSLFAHGLIIWEQPAQRAIALAVGASMLGMTLYLYSRSAFANRTVLELRQDQAKEGVAMFSITSGGRPVAGGVDLQYRGTQRRLEAASGEIANLASLAKAVFTFPLHDSHEVKVWAHILTPGGDSQGMPVGLEVNCGSETLRYDLSAANGQVLVPVSGDNCRLVINLGGYVQD